MSTYGGVSLILSNKLKNIAAEQPALRIGSFDASNICD
jgi:hypothetical protein